MKDKDFENLKKDIILQVNKIRTDPKSYIPIIEEYINSFQDDKNLLKPGTDIMLETQEGKRAYIETKNFLSKQKPIKELKLDDHLSQASQDWADEIGQKENFDSNTLNKYIDNYIVFSTPLITSVDYGSTTAEEFVVGQIVDDGSKTRPHRKALFSEIIKYFGVGVAPHKSEFDVVSIIDYVKDIKSYKGIIDEEEKITKEKVNDKVKNLYLEMNKDSNKEEKSSKKIVKKEGNVTKEIEVIEEKNSKVYRSKPKVKEVVTKEIQTIEGSNTKVSVPKTSKEYISKEIRVIEGSSKAYTQGIKVIEGSNSKVYISIPPSDIASQEIKIIEGSNLKGYKNISKTKEIVTKDFQINEEEKEKVGGRTEAVLSAETEMKRNEEGEEGIEENEEPKRRITRYEEEEDEDIKGKSDKKTLDIYKKQYATTQQKSSMSKTVKQVSAKKKNWVTKSAQKVIITRKEDEDRPEIGNYQSNIPIVIDPEAPKGAIKCHVRVYEKIQGRYVVGRITRKTYTLQDGSTVELRHDEPM